MFLCPKVANFAPTNKPHFGMRHFLLTILLAWCSLAATAQNVIIGEKVPEMRIKQWLMDLQPEAAVFTCIVFHHSESLLCRQCLEKVKELADNFGRRLNVVIVTKESYSKAGTTMTQHLDDRIGVAFDDNGRTFRYFGIKFIPYCVITNHKRRAVWCGNGNLLNERIIHKIITEK